MCIKKMLKWVKSRFCTNYFILQKCSGNLFDGKLNDNRRLIYERILEELLDVGCDCVCNIKPDNICNYMKSRKSGKCSKWLRHKVY